MRCFITGIAGFLGSRFAEWLLQNFCGVKIFGLDDLSCGYNENVPPGVAWNKLDLSTHEIYSVQDIDYFFHFAAYAAEGLSPFIRRFNYTNNLLATANVVNFCINRDVRRLVFTSSMAAYGNPLSWDKFEPGKPPFWEDDYCQPIDPYGIAKLACEQDIRAAGEQHDLDWCVIRPHNLYGPGQSIWQKYRNVLGNWMARSFEGLPLLVYGDGRQKRAFSYIDDCLPCIWQAATNDAASKQVINLGGPFPIEIGEAAKMVSKLTGAPIEHREPRHEVKEAWCTVEKSIKLLGYDYRTPLDAGLEEMLKWAKVAWEKYPYRRNHRPVERLEVERGVYGYWKELVDPVDLPDA